MFHRCCWGQKRNGTPDESSVRGPKTLLNVDEEKQNVDGEDQNADKEEPNDDDEEQSVDDEEENVRKMQDTTQKLIKSELIMKQLRENGGREKFINLTAREKIVYLKLITRLIADVGNQIESEWARRGLGPLDVVKRMQVQAEIEAAVTGNLVGKILQRLLRTMPNPFEDGSHPVFLVSLSDYRALNGFVKHENCTSILVRTTLSELHHRYPHIYFISHKWFRSSPDEDNKAFNESLTLISGLSEHDSDRTWVWCDYMCVPQDNQAQKAICLSTIPYILTKSVVIACSGVKPLDYKVSVWCQFELTFSSHITMKRPNGWFITKIEDMMIVIPSLLYLASQDPHLLFKLCERFEIFCSIMCLLTSDKLKVCRDGTVLVVD
jgi:hypothetical protein